MSPALYDLARLPPPEPTRPRCVVTLAVGPRGRELNAITGPFLEQYAARVGADYRVIAADEPGAYPLAFKWAVAGYVRAYDRVFYVDADALVRPSCPDVFALVPETHIGAVDEAADFLAKSPDGGLWWRKQVEDIQRQRGSVLSPHPFAFNAGVYVASRQHAAAFDPPDKVLTLGFCGEQHLLNEKILKLGMPVFPLPAAFNARWMWHGPAILDAANHVIHFSGIKDHGERVEQLKREADALNGRDYRDYDTRFHLDMSDLFARAAG